MSMAEEDFKITLEGDGVKITRLLKGKDAARVTNLLWVIETEKMRDESNVGKPDA